MIRLSDPGIEKVQKNFFKSVDAFKVETKFRKFLFWHISFVCSPTEAPKKFSM